MDCNPIHYKTGWTMIILTPYVVRFRPCKTMPKINAISIPIWISMRIHIP